MLCQKEKTHTPLPLENLGANSVDNPALLLKPLPPVKTESSAEGRKKFDPKEYHRQWVLANPERYKASQRKYYDAHKHEMAAKVDKEKKRAWSKKNNKNPIAKARRKELYRLNRPRRLAQARASRLRNPQYQLDYKKRRRRESLQVRFAEAMRLVVWRAVSRAGGIKSDHALKLIGCTIPALIAHLESLFLPGMSWKERSRWHVDHVRPLASYDLTKPEDQRAAFHFTNLQPLWAFDNQSKGDKWNG